jgi:hypothetical protein
VECNLFKENQNHSREFSAVEKHGYMYLALAEYFAVDGGEMTIKQGQTIEVLTIGNDGWWYARDVTTKQEGWVPASYLEPLVLSQ